MARTSRSSGQVRGVRNRRGCPFGGCADAWYRVVKRAFIEGGEDRQFRSPCGVCKVWSEPELAEAVA